MPEVIVSHHLTLNPVPASWNVPMQVVQESWPAIWAMVKSGGAAAWHETDSRRVQESVLAVNAPRSLSNAVRQPVQPAGVVQHAPSLPDLDKAALGLAGAAEACFMARMSAVQPVIDARRQLNNTLQRL
jgi:hypothetical protein